MLVTLGGCYYSCGSLHIGNPCDACTYALTWNPMVSGFPNVNLTLTPIVPPKALSARPSDYVQVNLTVGTFSFSTDDPAYQCLETVATTVLPIILAPQSEAISGFAAISDFLVVYQACGQFVQTSHVNLVALGGIATKELIFFHITGQRMVSRAANGQELAPSGPIGSTTPTPTLPPPPTVQILSPAAGASYYFTDPRSGFPLVLSSRASAGVISYAWSDTLGLLVDRNPDDRVTMRPSASQIPCANPVKDTISLSVTDRYGQTATAKVTIAITHECTT